MENGQWKMKSACVYGLTDHSPFSIFHSPFLKQLPVYGGGLNSYPPPMTPCEGDDNAWLQLRLLAERGIV